MATAADMLSPGDRVWVNIPHVGYVGVVTDGAKQAKEITFNVSGEKKTMSELPLVGNYLHSNDEPENAEYIVKIRWIKTVGKADAISELGFFGNQNTVCRPLTDKWNFTVTRLKNVEIFRMNR